MPELQWIGPEQIDGGDFSEIIDVRSPSEFAEDHVEGAVNLPVLDDAERAEVGTIYKQESSHRARRIGATLLARHAAEYLEGYLAEKPDDYSPLVYCWRGGMRSKGLATILAAVGWRTRLLTGGYKAFRNHLLESFEELLNRKPGFRFAILGGLTGSGKTRVLDRMSALGHQVVDLEGLANHRGSALGESTETMQPSQKRFENLIWQRLRTFDVERPVILESESSRIGKLQIPATLWKHMGKAPLIELEVPLTKRAEFLIDHYRHFVEDGELLCTKLDLLRHLHGAEQLDAWKDQIARGAWHEFVESILAVHYDPAYLRSRKKRDRVALATVSSDDISESGVEAAAREIAAAISSLNQAPAVPKPS